MATTTKRSLNKPERTSFVNVVTAINNNMDNLDDAVPDSRKVNGKALSSDIVIDGADLPVLNTAVADTQAMIAPPFVEATPNDAGTFVTNAGKLYYLPNGHTANATWANTSKTEVNVGSEVKNIKSDYSDLHGTVAPNYMQIAYPTVGTVVWHNGELVKNKVPISTGETFDPDKWETANVGNYLTDTSNNLQRVADSLGRATNITPIFFERGYCYLTVDTGELVTKSASTYYACALVPVVEGDKITINGTSSSGSNYRLYVFIDAEGKSMGRVAGSMTGERTITAPAGAVYCAINNRIASQPDGYYAYKGTAVSDFAEALSKTTEKIYGGYITPVNRTVGGVTFSVTGDDITMYGTSASGRYMCLFNGTNVLMPATEGFVKCFDPGTYYFEFSVSGFQNIMTIYGSYSAFSNGFPIVGYSAGVNSAYVKFEQPTMVGLVLVLNRDYGTSETPTVVTVKFKKLSAIDEVAREMKPTLVQALADIAVKAPAIVEQGSGVTINFHDGGDMPFKSCYATIAPKQLGTGDASPENIREIKGFTKYNITIAGENLFGGATMMKGIKASLPNATVNESAGTIAFAAGTTVSTEYPYFTDLCGMTGKFKAGTQYTFVLTLSKSSGTGANIAVVYTDGTMQAISGVSGTGKQTLAFTTMGGTSAAKTVKGIIKNNHSGTTTLYYNECAVLEGTTGYQRPYKGKMYEVELPTEAGDVYGGSLLVRADGSGTLTVDRGMYVFDGASKILSVSESSTGIMAMRSINFGNNAVNGDLTAISNQYSRAVSAAPQEGTAIRISIGDAGAIFVYDNRFTDAETAAALCEANPIQVCYALANPITYEFTPGQIKSILGENNVWAESGDMSVQYCADTKIYIDAAIAAALGS